ncbi:MAG: DUF3857 and transglutaminase domain-containing protein [Bacteroidota bacterium]
MIKILFCQRAFFTFLSLGLFLFCSVKAFAQPEPMKFGKVEMKDLEMKFYDKDTSASAVVLYDYGNAFFTYISNDFQVNFERHVRIKILKKSGYDWADSQISLYKSDNTEEKVTNLKGYTYTLENGKIVKTKLEKEHIFDDKLSENESLKKFTMPGVKEGCVIEYSYTVQSEFLYTFQEWEFQKSIPVLWSEYRARIPEFYIYKQHSQGYEPFFINTSEEGRESFAVRYEAENSSQGMARTPGSIENVEVKNTQFRWVIKDIPALHEEPYVTTMSDFVSKIEFELTATNFSHNYKPFRSSWEELAKDLLESESFGKQLNRTGFVKDEIEGIKAKFTDPAERIFATQAFVKKTMKWDGKKRVYPATTLKKAYENRTGNSSDINLLLVAMLKEEGIDASPVILSTRDNGRAPFFPLLTRYNYVIAQVNLNGKVLLLDATEPFAPYDVLPQRCLNGVGRLISMQTGEVELRNNEKFMSYCNAKLTLGTSGELSGVIEESQGGYYGLLMRKEVAKEGKDKYVEAMKKNHVGWEIESFDFKNLEKTNEILLSTCKVTIGEQAQNAAKLMYLNPMFYQKKDANPFKLENRKFPVDFAAPIDETFLLTIALPAGYEVEELPKPAIISLPEGAAKFTYSVSVSGSILQVVSKLTIKKTFFGVEEYAHLKEFYNYIVTKHAEQIVLKKKG